MSSSTSDALLGPDFFIVGAPKCGTTSLDTYLAEHPQIFMGRIAYGGHLPGNMRLQRFAQLGAAQRDGAE